MLFRSRGKTCVLIALADRAIHQKCIGRRSLTKRPRRGALLAGSSAHFRSRFSLFALRAVLVVGDYLLKSAAPPGQALQNAAQCSRRGSCILASCAAILSRRCASRASHTGSARKLPAAKPAARLVSTLCAGAVPARGGILLSGGACGALIGRSRRSCGSFDIFERRDLQRQIDRSGSLAQIEFLGGVIEAQLAGFDSVMPGRQSRQIETPVFVRPTDPGTPAAGFHQAKARARNGHAGWRAQ